MSFVTRIAPTPSGYLHRGNAYNFLLIWLMARTQNGRILLRIDDLDKGRTRTRFLSSIFSDLEWMGIDWDDGPTSMEHVAEFSQYQRMDLYQNSLDSIRTHVDIFGCTCTRKMIAKASRDGLYPGTCRMHNVEDGKIWRLWTKGAQGCINGVPQDIDSTAVVLRNRAGVPSYMLACVLDDAHHNVDVIVRGADLYTSSIAQSYLRSILGIDKQPVHIHHPLLLNKEGKKLSKSTKSLSLSALREEGFSTADLYSDFAQWRGWNQQPQNQSDLQEIFLQEDPLRDYITRMQQRSLI